MDIHRSPRKWYGVSAAAVGVALLVNLVVAQWIRPLVFWPFFLAVLAGSFFGGAGPGLAAAALSLAARIVLIPWLINLQLETKFFSSAVNNTYAIGQSLVFFCRQLRQQGGQHAGCANNSG